MATDRKPLDTPAVSIMLGLSLAWGLQQVAIKVAAPAIDPVMQIGLRSAVAAILVALFMKWRGVSPFARDGTLYAGLAAGGLFALEFLLIGMGLRLTTASHMSVFLYTSPIFTALGLQLLVPGERLTPLQWTGVCLAFLGVAASFSHGLREAADAYPLMWLGDLFGVLAGFAWGMTTVCIRATVLSETLPSKTLLYQLGACAVALPLYAWITGAASIGDMTALAWTSMVYQTIVVGFATLLLWFWLLRRYLATRLSVFTFLTPVFGVIFGVWLLNDPFESIFAVGALLILAGIVLVNLPARRRR